jgi:putative aldouronate transport system permease protein
MSERTAPQAVTTLPDLSHIRDYRMSSRERLLRRIWRERYIYMLVLPGVLFFLIFRYLPMVGLVLAFKDYSPFIGIWDSPWVGLDHFRTMFQDPEVLQVIRNTLYISALQIAFVFPIPIALAIMLNEVDNQAYKRIIQSILYLPHFISWVIVIGIVTIFLRSEGVANKAVETLFGADPIPFLISPNWFAPLIILEVIWKEAGWGTIIFLAALAGIDPQLYEASVVDGASRWHRIWDITLPGLRPTIVILLILRLGSVLDTGFEQIFLMLNPFNMDVGNVLDTYVYFKGIQQADFSFATAVGVFKGLIGLILVVGANRLAKRLGEEGLY